MTATSRPDATAASNVSDPLVVLSSRSRATVVIGVLVGAVPMTMAALAIGVLAGDELVVVSDTVAAALVIGFSAAGIALVRYQSTRILGVLVLAAATIASIELLAHATMQRSTEAEAAWAVEALTTGLTVGVVFHFLLALPEGRVGSGAPRGLLWVGYASVLVAALVRWRQQPDPAVWPMVLIALGLGVVGVAVAGRRYARVSGPTRQRMQWLGLAVVLWAELVLVVVGLHILVAWPPRPVETAAASLLLVAGSLVAAATPAVVGRIERLLSHAVALAGLTGVVTVIYVFVVVGLGRVPTEEDKTILVLSMAAAAVCALAYPRARERLAAAAARLVYGSGYDPTETLESFAGRLTRAVPLDELLLQLCEHCVRHLALASAEVWTGTGGELVRVASVPHRDTAGTRLGDKELPVASRARVSGRSWAEVWMPSLLDGLGSGPVRLVPLVHTGQLFGIVVLERPDPAEDFTEEDERVLGELARQIAVALHNSELDSALQATLEEVQRTNGELRASRARLVAAADLERRRIERNLHDGAQQNLVALAVKLRLAQRLGASDPEAALAMVEEAHSETLATVEELRALAHGIYPPLLMDRGLTIALGAAADRSPLATTVEAAGVGRYDQQHEAAAYFCCLEALQNAAKHAGEDATVEITLDQVDGELRFCVTDDGVGFDPDACEPGHGFVNMADRLGAIGGSLEIHSERGVGTRISGRIPLTGEGNA